MFPGSGQNLPILYQRVSKQRQLVMNMSQTVIVESWVVPRCLSQSLTVNYSLGQRWIEGERKCGLFRDARKTSVASLNISGFWQNPSIPSCQLIWVWGLVAAGLADFSRPFPHSKHPAAPPVRPKNAPRPFKWVPISERRNRPSWGCIHTECQWVDATRHLVSRRVGKV